MKRFLLLIREDVNLQLEATKQQFDVNIQKMMKWVEELSESGNFISGEALQTYGNYVDGNDVMSGVPYMNAKEAVSGYVLIRAENINQAGAIAQSCPEVLKGRIAIEVRPIIEMQYD